MLQVPQGQLVPTPGGPAGSITGQEWSVVER